MQSPNVNGAAQEGNEPPAVAPNVGKDAAIFHARGLFGHGARVGFNGATGLYEIRIKLRGRSKASRLVGSGPTYHAALVAAIQASQPSSEGVAR